MIERNQIKDLKPLVDAAKADSAGPKRFAPYLHAVLRGQPPPRQNQVGPGRRPQGRRSQSRGVEQRRFRDSRSSAHDIANDGCGAAGYDRWPSHPEAGGQTGSAPGLAFRRIVPPKTAAIRSTTARPRPTPDAPAAALSRAIERLENMRQVCGVDPETLVLHGQRHTSSPRARLRP